MPSARWPYPRYFAHRGGGTLAPENTLAGIRAAHAAGFEAVEFDVMLATDGVPVLMHDESVDRTTNSHGPMSGFDSAALDRLDAGVRYGSAFPNEPVPRFDAALRLCLELGLRANIEIKPLPDAEIDTARVVAVMTQGLVANASNTANAVLLSSFNESAIATALQVAPALPRAMLYEAVPPDWHHRVTTLQCIGLHCSADTLDAEHARSIVEAGYGLAVYTVNDAVEAKRLFDMDVDAVFTDRLDLFGARARQP